MSDEGWSSGSFEDAFLRLFSSLEQVRSRLAVAIASESKSTPLDRLRYYRETEERVYRCLRELRAQRSYGNRLGSRWLESLAVLGSLPGMGAPESSRPISAQQLCLKLREALAPLERADPPDPGWA